MTQQLTPIVGDLIITGSAKYQREGRVIKVLEPKSPSPGGIVVDNKDSTFWVAPWEKVVVVNRKYVEGR